MAVTTPMSQAGLEQLIQKADVELSLLEEEAEHAEKSLATAQSELGVIASRQGARFQSLRMAEETVSQLKEELATAQARARLSENTLASGDPGEASVKELTGKVQKAESELSKLRAKLSKESSADDQREARARNVLDQAQKSLTQIASSQQSISAAREQAFEELGLVIQKAVVQRLTVLKEEVEVRRQCAERAAQEVDEFSREATQRLLTWPVLLEQVNVYRDNTTAVIEAMVAFLNVCLNQGKDSADIDTHVFSRAGMGQFTDLFAMLSFGSDDYYGILRGSGFDARLNGPLALEERRDQLIRLLQVYLDSKRGE